MVLPFKHADKLETLNPETRSEMMEIVNKSTIILQKIYSPEGFNLGANLGSAAGAGIEQHVHMHVVPRWIGDTNFMSTIGETRVLPEALEESWQNISKKWNN